MGVVAGAVVAEDEAKVGIVVDLGTNASTFSPPPPPPPLTSPELLLAPTPNLLFSTNPPPFPLLLSFLLSFTSAAFSKASNNDGFTATIFSLSLSSIFPPTSLASAPTTEGFVLIEGTGGAGNVLLIAFSLSLILLLSSSSFSLEFQLGAPTIFPSTTNKAACSSASSTILSSSATLFIVPAVLSPASPIGSKYPLPPAS